jgi:hypothetical protein
MLGKRSGQHDEGDPDGTTSTTESVWAGWQRLRVRTREPSAPAEQQSPLRQAIAAGEVEPPREFGWPDIIPELADLASLADDLIAARERERVLRVVSCLTLRCLGRSGHGESSSATKE